MSPTQSLSAVIAELRVDIHLLRGEVQELRTKQDQLIAQANKWKGGLAVILALGGVIGLLLRFLNIPH